MLLAGQVPAVDQGAAAVMRSLADREPALLVGDDWSPARSGDVRQTIDPSTGSPFARYAVAGPADVDAVVAAAREAQPAWAALPVQARAACLERLADIIEDHAEHIALVDAIDAGLPVERMLGDVAGAVRALRSWRGVAESLRGEVLPDPESLHYTRYRPFGVVAKVVAYNHPFLFAVKGSLAALIAGNSVVVKPADQTPMSALLLSDLARGVFPPGVFSFLTGDAHTGDALVTHPDVRRIGFTGSAGTGRLIQRRAAEDAVRSVSLELGGKNAMIVFPDVDVPRVAHEVVKAMNLRANAGQSCGSTSRIFLHDQIHDVFVDELCQELQSLTLGPAYDRSVDMGPVISAEHAERVRGFIDGARSSANLVAGGLDDGRVPDHGFFVAPTLFIDVDDRSALATEEVFGPVIAGFRWNDRDDLLHRVNAVDYGLTASIWTRDVSEAIRTADAVEAGYVWVNDSTTHYWGTPFGGWKDSGLGREESREELLGYLQLKSVHVRVDAQTAKES